MQPEKSPSNQLTQIKQIAVDCGKLIMNIYHDAFEVKQKDDHSPLTLADTTASRFILEELSRLYPNDLLLSEEGPIPSYTERKQGGRIWIIDPLDGTREFVKKNGEFTVNIALVENAKPSLGIVHIPASGVTYGGERGGGSFKWTRENSSPQRLPLVNRNSSDTYYAVLSGSHLEPKTEKLVQELQVKLPSELAFIRVGSAIKFGLVAEGTADFYLRCSRIMEWDTAAGQIVVEEAGGVVLSREDLLPMCYNKENLRNPEFICLSHRGKGFLSAIDFKIP